ncbi:MAG: ion transporter [Spirochaetales bacterium]|nr:ion transporter [Spirochaetales bacterium]
MKSTKFDNAIKSVFIKIWNLKIHPQGNFKVFWEAFVLLLTLIMTIIAPLMVVFEIPSKGPFLVFDLILTTFFTIDIYVNFHTSLLVKRKEIHDRKKIAKEYLKGWFWIDLFATVPLHLIFGISSFVMLNRILRFTRLFRLVKLFSSSSTKTLKRIRELPFINPSIMRLLLMVFLLLIAGHLIACGWMFISGNPDNLDSNSRYIEAYYWTLTTLTTIGYGDISPKTNTLRIYVMFIQLIGAGMYGFIIGNIANLISNIDVAKTQYKEKVDRINTFLKYKNIPLAMQKRINDYYEYLWDNRRGYDESSVLSDLPKSLKTTVSLFLNREIIEKVPLFKGASDEFLTELILTLEPVIYTPGDYVMKKGEMGFDMFFISKGSVDVVSEDEKIVYATLTDGAFFGEIALLLSTPRTATIKAKDYCDLYSLHKDTFQKILQRYPDFAQSIEEEAIRRKDELDKQG